MGLRRKESGISAGGPKDSQQSTRLTWEVLSTTVDDLEEEDDNTSSCS